MKFKLGNIVHDCDNPDASGQLVTLTAKTAWFRVGDRRVSCPASRLRLGHYRVPPVRYKYPLEVRERASKFGLTVRQYIDALK